MSSPKEFRVYHPKHGMFEVAALDCSDEVVVALDREHGSYVEHRWFGGEVEVMQYIGLDDADGTHIYEGDILDVTIGSGEDRSPEETRGSVHYNSSSAQFGVRLGTQFVDFGRIQESEVVGNIHEHSDLLE